MSTAIPLQNDSEVLLRSSLEVLTTALALLSFHSPPRFELHADGGALRQASCRNACGSRPDSPYGLLPGDAPREIPPPLFGASITGCICGGDAGLLSSRGPSRTSSQTLQGLKETHSVTLTEEVRLMRHLPCHAVYTLPMM